MTAAAWNTDAPADAVEELVDRGRVADVADDDFDPRVDHLEQRGVVRARAPGTGCGGAAAPASARTRFWPSQPAAPVTTTVDAGALEGRAPEAACSPSPGPPSRTKAEAIASRGLRSIRTSGR